LILSSGGVASSTTISAGGVEQISSGGTDVGALISGGAQLVYDLPAAQLSSPAAPKRLDPAASRARLRSRAAP
jgi:autotransporter passenger strand-loop-strand repeat protein